ncbi:MAG: type II and III secretion system protein family protein [Longimicrobiales bacterium]
MTETFGRSARRLACRLGAAAALSLSALVTGPVQTMAQQVVSQAQETYQLERGKTSVLQLNYTPVRVAIGDSTIFNILTLDTPREYLLNGLAIGTSTLIIWDPANVPHLYNVEVVADATSLQNQLQTIFPGQDLNVSSSGEAIILSGVIRDPIVARRAIELAQGTGARVINNLQAPPPQQILLRVRFAEVRHSTSSRLGADLFGRNVAELDQVFGDGSTANIETLSEGIVRLFLIGEDAQLDAVITALKAKGEFRSLAEPNLLTVEGVQASFLAGGEFPYPSVQTGAQSGAVTIQFREFGVRLSFTPTITNAGAVHLQVEPEVSTLDFANGLQISGFSIPSLLTRKASSEVELRPGQHLAIAGLMDNTMSDAVSKIPLLGDLPILGALFRSKTNEQDRTELLVIVTPYVVDPSDTPIPVPTGEPGTWRWDRSMRMDTTGTRSNMQLQGRDGGQ